MIHKGVVLLRIQYLEHCRRGVAEGTLVEFVDFVDQQNRIPALGFPDGLDDFSGKCADVSPAVSADFRFISNSTQADSDKLPVQCACDGLGKGGFSDPGRTGEAENRAFQGFLQ